MRKILLVSGLLLAAGLTTTAQALEMPYLTVGGAEATYEFKEVDNISDAKPKAVRLVFGSDFTNYFGAEAHILKGSSSSEAEISPGTATIDIDVDLIYSILLKARFELGSVATIYGTAGYSYGRLSSVSAASFEDNISDDGGSYGGGIEIGLTKNLRLDFSYNSYLDKKTYGLSAVGAGLKIKF